MAINIPEKNTILGNLKEVVLIYQNMLINLIKLNKIKKVQAAQIIKLINSLSF